MQKKKDRIITREEMLITKSVSHKERKKIKVFPNNYVIIRQEEKKIEEYILISFKKAQNNSNTTLRVAFEREIKSFNESQYLQIMKYIDRILDRLEIYNRKVYAIRRARNIKCGNRDDVPNFSDLSDDEVNELFRLYTIRLKEKNNI